MQCLAQPKHETLDSIRFFFQKDQTAEDEEQNEGEGMSRICLLCLENTTLLWENVLVLVVACWRLPSKGACEQYSRVLQCRLAAGL